MPQGCGAVRTEIPALAYLLLFASHQSRHLFPFLCFLGKYEGRQGGPTSLFCPYGASLPLGPPWSPESRFPSENRSGWSPEWHSQARSFPVGECLSAPSHPRCRGTLCPLACASRLKSPLLEPDLPCALGTKLMFAESRKHVSSSLGCQR